MKLRKLLLLFALLIFKVSVSTQGQVPHKLRIHKTCQEAKASSFPPNSIEGEWTGAFKTQEGWVSFKAQFKVENNLVKGSMELSPKPPASEVQAGASQALVNVIVKSDRVHFELPQPDGNLVFDCALKENELSGSFKKGETSGPVQLVRFFPIKPAVYESYSGEYETGPKSYLSIFKLSQQAEEGELAFFDSETGRMGYLRSLSGTSFIAGSSFMADLPIEIRATFVKHDSGRVENLIWQRQGFPDVRAPKADFYSAEKVTFHNGDTALAGTLKIPRTKGPHPAIVFVHGSGPGTRNQSSALAHFFLHQGIAILGFDKRGIGESQGDWRRVDFDVLASDVVSAVKFLKRHEKITPSQIGLYGVSQGGWVSPLAASLSPDIAFFISHSGPGVTPKEQEFYTVTNIMKKSGFAEEEINGLLNVFSLLYDYSKTGKGADELDAAIEKLKSNPKLAGFLPPPAREISWEAFYEKGKQQLGDPGWFYHLDVNFNPVPVYKKIACPALIIFGQHDFTVPVEESISRIEKALRESKHKSYTIKVFQNAGHGILEVDKNNPAQMASPPRVIPGYLEFLAAWLQQVLQKP